MEKSNVDMTKKSWRINVVMKRLLWKWLKMSKRSGAASSASVPTGCFPVYVGEGDRKERFVVKTEHANHPLFKSLLEDAELEYGLRCQGPISLPCHPDFFFKVLSEMENSHQGHRSCSNIVHNDDDDSDDLFHSAKTPGSNQMPKYWWLPLWITPNDDPKVRRCTSKSDDGAKQCCGASPYRLPTPPNSLLKLN